MQEHRDAPPSARRLELLDAAYGYVLQHGIASLSLRPLASAIGSSPRVLLFLFGSKDGLVRALLARAREDELALLDDVSASVAAHDLAAVAAQVWGWLAAEERRGLLTMWVEGYARGLTAEPGAWTGFPRDTVEDWLELLAGAQAPELRASPAGAVQRTLVLALLRGGLLDLLATGDLPRVDAAVRSELARLAGRASP